MSRTGMKAAIMEIILPEMVKTEGKKNVVYLDTEGYPTVGIGHKVRPHDNLKVGDRISNERIADLFNQDIGPAINAAMDQAIDVGEFEKDFVLALTQVNYQLGVNWPKSWPNTYRKLKAGDWDGVMRAVRNSKWARQTPVRTAAFIKALMQEKLEDNQYEPKQPATVVVDRVEEEVKPGKATTEFWVTVLAPIVTSLVMIANHKWNLGLDPEHIGNIFNLFVAYVVGRPALKAVNTIYTNREGNQS